MFSKVRAIFALVLLLIRKSEDKTKQQQKIGFIKQIPLFIYKCDCEGVGGWIGWVLGMMRDELRFIV